MAELLTMDLSGLDKLKTFSRKMLERSKDLTPVFQVGDEVFRAMEHEQFATEGVYLLGHEWKPLNPQYLTEKLRHNPPPAPFGILYRTGAMYESFTSPGGDHIARISPREATYGSADPKAKWHQEGTKKMPRRQIVKATNLMMQRMTRLAITYILRGRMPRPEVSD